MDFWLEIVSHEDKPKRSPNKIIIINNFVLQKKRNKTNFLSKIFLKIKKKTNQAFVLQKA